MRLLCCRDDVVSQVHSSDVEQNQSDDSLSSEGGGDQGAKGGRGGGRGREDEGGEGRKVRGFFHYSSCVPKHIFYG